MMKEKIKKFLELKKLYGNGGKGLALKVEFTALGEELSKYYGNLKSRLDRGEDLTPEEQSDLEELEAVLNPKPQPTVEKPKLSSRIWAWIVRVWAVVWTWLKGVWARVKKPVSEEQPEIEGITPEEDLLGIKKEEGETSPPPPPEGKEKGHRELVIIFSCLAALLLIGLWLCNLCNRETKKPSDKATEAVQKAEPKPEAKVEPKPGEPGPSTLTVPGVISGAPTPGAPTIPGSGAPGAIVTPGTGTPTQPAGPPASPAPAPGTPGAIVQGPPAPPTIPGAQQAAPKDLKKLMELATIRDKEGKEHPVIRLLMNDPSLVEGVKIMVFGKVYDLTYNKDKQALKVWAGRTAHLIALHFGWVDFGSGREMWIKAGGTVALKLEKVGDKLVAYEYENTVTGFKDEPIIKTSSSDKMSKFDDNKVQGYEYPCTPNYSHITSASAGHSAAHATQLSSNANSGNGPATMTTNLQPVAPVYGLLI